jgi:HNH endonuclease/Homeodomain-like domain
MKLDFCVACGVRDSLHHHHLVPRIEGGSDDDSNMITLCEDCHGRVHGVAFKDHRKLHRIGVDKARAAGKFKGRVPVAHRQAEVIRALADKGWTRARIAEATQTSERSVYRTLKAVPMIRSLIIPISND